MNEMGTQMFAFNLSEGWRLKWTVDYGGLDPGKLGDNVVSVNKMWSGQHRLTCVIRQHYHYHHHGRHRNADVALIRNSLLRWTHNGHIDERHTNIKLDVLIYPATSLTTWRPSFRSCSKSSHIVPSTMQATSQPTMLCQHDTRQGRWKTWDEPE